MHERDAPYGERLPRGTIVLWVGGGLYVVAGASKREPWTYSLLRIEKTAKPLRVDEAVARRRFTRVRAPTVEHLQVARAALKSELSARRRRRR